jgi:transcription elongation GreA/GreB family factor
MADLFATLERLQIHPIGASDSDTVYVEHRTAAPVTSRETTDVDEYSRNGFAGVKSSTAADGIRSGDRVVIRYLDDNKTAAFTLSREQHDPINGILSVASPLGSRLVGRVEEDETEFDIDGRSRPVLIVRTERQGATSGSAGKPLLDLGCDERLGRVCARRGRVRAEALKSNGRATDSPA